MSTSTTGPTVVQRWRTLRWVLLALVVIVGVSTVAALLTASRSGARMDPESTSPDGAHAIVTLLKDHGVDVVPADDIATVVRSARRDSLLVVAPTAYLIDDAGLQQLNGLPGDLLLVEPLPRSAPPPARVSAASPTAICAKPPGRAALNSIPVPPSRPSQAVPR
jgi:hypothetical protein